MGEINVPIRALSDSTYFKYSAVTLLAQDIAKCVQIRQDVQQIQKGNDALVQGQV